jgi:DNA polymerase IV
VRVRFADLRAVSRSVTLPQPVSATAILAEIAEELVHAVLAKNPDERTISLLAISVSGLEQPPVTQLELPFGLADEARRPGSRKAMARALADGAMDKVRDRFGWAAVNYGPLAMGQLGAVPDAFRRLAEKEL